MSRPRIIELVNEGKTEYEFFPCKIESSEAEAQKQADREELLLILTNSQREKTDWEKMEEVRRLRAILERSGQKGIRGKLAEVLDTSPTAIGRLEAISKHLIPELQEEMREQRLGVSAAYELSGLPEAEQRQALNEQADKNSFSVKAAREKKESAVKPVEESRKTQVQNSAKEPPADIKKQLDEAQKILLELAAAKSIDGD
ncbi:MAG: hypothetical protein OSJ64_01610, partial [Firmicutes bacterium]|nr:hypothetical protein [Bacillota bacterium]